jgi:predicted GIY-YIG superfamily endonuclease
LESIVSKTLKAAHLSIDETDEIDRRPYERVTALYRHYDSQDVLLYVGITLSVIDRIKAHRNGSHWFDQVTRITVERHPSRTAALKAECDAVYKERPVYNKQLQVRGEPYVPPPPKPKVIYDAAWAIEQFRLP